jgi:microcystin-dependent protein
MARREYMAGKPTTLSADFSIGGASFTVAAAGNDWPDGAEGYNFWVTIDGGTPQEERVLCSSRAGTTITVAAGGRGADGTTESNHSQGATVWPSWSATDADEANAHINSVSNVHGLATAGPSSTSGGAVVGTSAEQTLTNKTLTTPKINGATALTASAAELNILDGATLSTAELNILDGLTASTTELNYVDGVTSAIQTQLDTIVNTTIPNSTPVGTIVMYGGTSAPTGWLLCNGQSTTGYTALAAVVGANVPDLRGRTPIGYGQGTGLTNRNTIGAQVGAETHQLSVGELPSFNHELQLWASGLTSGTYFKTEAGTYGGSVFYGHGSNQPHNNMQPSTVVNFIIKH